MIPKLYSERPDMQRDYFFFPYFVTCIDIHLHNLSYLINNPVSRASLTLTLFTMLPNENKSTEKLKLTEEEYATAIIVLSHKSVKY